jgi:opacity protein-like surface antigen
VELGEFLQDRFTAGGYYECPIFTNIQMKIIRALSLVPILTVAFSSKALAQTSQPEKRMGKVYVSLASGFGFGAAGTSAPFGGDYTFTETNNGSATTQTNTGISKPLNLGKGMHFGLGGGVFVTKNIGVELNLDYLFGSVYTVGTLDTYPNGVTNSSKIVMNANMLRIIPALRFQFGEGKLYPYLRTGVVIGAAGRMELDGTTDGDQRTTIYTGGGSWGFLCGLGARYAISNKLDVFVELTEILQTWAPEKSELTKETLNGTDIWPTLNTSQKETIYSSSYSATTVNQMSPPNSPVTKVKEYWPLSSIGFTLGLNIKLN